MCPMKHSTRSSMLSARRYPKSSKGRVRVSRSERSATRQISGGGSSIATPKASPSTRSLEKGRCLTTRRCSDGQKTTPSFPRCFGQFGLPAPSTSKTRRLKQPRRPRGKTPTGSESTRTSGQPKSTTLRRTGKKSPMRVTLLTPSSYKSLQASVRQMCGRRLPSSEKTERLTKGRPRK